MMGDIVAGLLALMPEILWELCTGAYRTALRAVLPWPK